VSANVCLQDVPFLALRLYCLSLGVFGYSLLFYTTKNVLIVVLESYRLTVLALRSLRPGFDEPPTGAKSDIYQRRLPSVAVVLGADGRRRGSTASDDWCLVNRVR